MNKPLLLTKYELVKPKIEAINRIGLIKSQLITSKEKVILEGLFVLTVASFETSVIDSLKALLKHIPHKLNNTSFTFSKDDVINENLLDKAIESNLLSFSYKNVKEIVSTYIKSLSLDMLISD